MDNVLNFLANNYLWFLGASIFFAFALFGLIYEGKKKKKAEEKAKEAAENPAITDGTTAPTSPAPEAPVDMVAQAMEVGPTVPAEPVQPEVATATPTLEGLESNATNYQADNFNAPAQNVETLVIEEKPASEEPTLVIEDKPAEGENKSLFE